MQQDHIGLIFDPDVLRLYWQSWKYLNFLTEENRKLLERKLQILYTGELKVYDIVYNIEGSGCWYFVTLFFVVVFR